MSDKELTPVEKVQRLERAALNSSPEEIARIYAELGKVELSARALAFAFRFRDVECVKALVESGASLDVPFTNYMINTYGTYGDDFCVTLLEKFPKHGIMLFTVVPTILNYPFKLENGTEPKPQPFEKRAETVRYLIKHGEKAGFSAGELLFYAIVFEDEKMTVELKRLGVTLTEKRRRMLTEKSGQNDILIWTSFLERSKTERFVPALSRLQRELGAKFHNTKGIYEAIFDKLYIPENLRFYLKNFDKPTPNQTNILKLMIVKNSIAGLAFAESVGWLKHPKKRDELIEYASERNSTECTAWLLDFKNRTADLAAECAKAEKKQERELNASPDSVSVLKTLWNYKKREDGTIIINGYKGDRTEIEVPAKIGKSPVTAIKSEAFCPYQGGVIKKTNGRFLKTITEITLPASVVEIGEKAFAYIDNLTVKAPRGSFAEKYCKEHNINYIPKGD
ncbi:MAG: hypothetical protein K2J77_02405 [Oscillospiraceae bacterium]|nr:hypothetical protein [Oscillospiraceae bacterium]